jgi:hypothetical protein
VARHRRREEKFCVASEAEKPGFGRRERHQSRASQVTKMLINKEEIGFLNIIENC